MSYTPVPAFLTGDTIDEPFLNTYWRDNMAAGLPDMFSAKGQLPVGLGVDDMGILNVGTDGTVLTADSTQPTGLKWDTKSSIVFLNPKVTVNGPTAVGSSTRSAITDFGVPANAVAILMSNFGWWSDVSSHPLAYVFCGTSSSVALHMFPYVNGEQNFVGGIVPLTSGQYKIQIFIAAMGSHVLGCYKNP